jgi:hypothetical protein
LYRIFNAIDHEDKGAISWIDLKVALFPEWSFTEIYQRLRSKSNETEEAYSNSLFPNQSEPIATGADFDISLLFNSDSSQKFNSIAALRDLYVGHVELTQQK